MITSSENPKATLTLCRDGLYMASNDAIADVGVSGGAPEAAG